MLGTRILKCDKKTIGVVIKTSFSTEKGKLVNSIMYPKNDAYLELHYDSIKFLFLMGIIALISMIYSITILVILKAGI
jgi:cation-transporting ATPase 13A2